MIGALFEIVNAASKLRPRLLRPGGRVANTDGTQTQTVLRAPHGPARIGYVCVIGWTESF